MLLCNKDADQPGYPCLSVPLLHVYAKIVCVYGLVSVSMFEISRLVAFQALYPRSGRVSQSGDGARTVKLTRVI